MDWYDDFEQNDFMKELEMAAWLESEELEFNEGEENE